MLRFSLTILFVVLAAFAPQRAAAQAAVNVASFANPNLPTGALAPGGMFTVFGSGLGPASLVQVGVFPLPTDLSGTSVSATIGGTTLDCFMIFTSSGQVAAILPSSTPTGEGTMTVTYNGSSTAPFPVTVVPHSFGTFGINSAGSGPGVLTNASTSAVNTIGSSAAPGEQWDIWGTGLGAVPFADNDFPVVQDLGYNVQVFVGGVEAQVIYAGRSGCCAAVDQIRFVVPDGLSGCYLPVYVVVNGVPSNFTSMSVAPGGGACSDPGGITTTALGDGNLTVGIVALQRTTTELNIPNLPGVPQTIPSSTTGEAASASYQRYDADLAIRQGFNGQLFTQGACSVFQFRGESGDFVDPVQPVGLDAGPSASISGGPGARTLNRVETGQYVATLSSSQFPFAGLAAATKDLGLRTIRAGLGGGADQGAGQYFTGGTYTYSAPGGSDVGQHSQSIEIPGPLSWTNKDQISQVNRSQGQTVTWTPVNGEVMIVGNSFRRLAGEEAVGAGFFCLANGSAGSFNISAAVLQSLPVSETISEGGFSIETGTMSVGSNKRVECQASGLDVCLINYSDFVNKFVGYQ